MNVPASLVHPPRRSYEVVCYRPDGTIVDDAGRPVRLEHLPFLREPPARRGLRWRRAIALALLAVIAVALAWPSAPWAPEVRRAAAATSSAVRGLVATARDLAA